MKRHTGPCASVSEHSAWLADLASARLAVQAGDFDDALSVLRQLEREVLGYTPPPGHRTRAREKVLRKITHFARVLEARA